MINIDRLVVVSRNRLDMVNTIGASTKTMNTTRENQQEITFFCDEFILAIIARWGNKDQSPENYIFPFLTPGMDGYAIRYKVQLVTHLINEHMYAIAEELGISFLQGTRS